MYFILRWIAILVFAIVPSSSASLVLVAIIFASYGIVIALVCPYKKTYMNIIDTLIIENLALLALMLDKYLSEDSNPSLALCYVIVLSLFTLLPLLGLMVAISYRIVRRIRSELRTYKAATFCHLK